MLLLLSLLVDCMLVGILNTHSVHKLIFTGSQVMLYFVGGSLSYIVEDLGATTNGSWLPVANTLAITAVAPFVGKLYPKKIIRASITSSRISPGSGRTSNHHFDRVYRYHGGCIAHWRSSQLRHGKISDPISA